MSRHAIVLSLLLAAAPTGASAQGATDAQTRAVTAIAECLALGLPEQWKRFQMTIELPAPYSDTGGVLYLVTLPDDRTQPLKPCDPGLPPRELLGIRDGQPDKERGWTKAILTMRPDASFDLKYEYPKPPAR
ncbi:MAG TPA: hypothetical protein VF110_05470 [Burkholderiales bacterium]|jgi:hypothetical protein